MYYLCLIYDFILIGVYISIICNRIRHQNRLTTLFYCLLIIEVIIWLVLYLILNIIDVQIYIMQYSCISTIIDSITRHRSISNIK